MKLVNDRQAVKARMLAPTTDGFLMLAAEVGTWRGPFPPDVSELAFRTKELGQRLQALEVNVFRAILRPPGEGEALLAARGISPARYNLVVLARVESPQTALRLRESTAYQTLAATVRAACSRTVEIAAANAARLGDVDHTRDHAFLFNYFYADDTDTLMKVWQYTAGWFQAKTALPNSTVLQPLQGEPATYGIVNHASWPHLRAFLPSLLFRPTFRSFVLANFRANNIAAQPIIYRCVK